MAKKKIPTPEEYFAKEKKIPSPEEYFSLKKKDDSEVSSIVSPEVEPVSTSKLIEEAEGYTPPEISLQEQAEAEKSLPITPEAPKTETEVEIAEAAEEFVTESQKRYEESLPLYHKALSEARENISIQKEKIAEEYKDKKPEDIYKVIPTTGTVGGYPVILTDPEFAKKVRPLELSEKYLDEVASVLEAESGKGGLSAAKLRVKHFDDLITLGWSNVLDAGQLKKVAQKSIEGKDLSQQEQTLLAFYGFKEDVKNDVEVPLAYDVIGGMIDMVPYMANIAVTGGIGASVSKATGTVIKETSKKAIAKYAAKGANYLLGKSVQALAMPMTYEGTLERQVGQVTYDEDGNLKVIEGDDPSTAFWKSYGSTVIEIGIEGVMDDVVRAGKLTQSKGLGALIRKETKFGSFTEELIEEFATAVAQAPIEGMTLEETFTPRMMATTTLAVGGVSGAMMGLDVATGKNKGKSAAKNRADMESFGKLLSAQTKKKIDDVVDKEEDLEEAGRKIEQIVDEGRKDKGWDNEAVFTVMSYASARNKDNHFNKELRKQKSQEVTGLKGERLTAEEDVTKIGDDEVRILRVKEINEIPEGFKDKAVKTLDDYYEYEVTGKDLKAQISDVTPKVEQEPVKEEKVAEKVAEKPVLEKEKPKVEPKIEEDEKKLQTQKTEASEGVSEKITKDKKEDDKRKEEVAPVKLPENVIETESGLFELNEEQTKQRAEMVDKYGKERADELIKEFVDINDLKKYSVTPGEEVEQKIKEDAKELESRKMRIEAERKKGEGVSDKDVPEVDRPVVQDGKKVEAKISKQELINKANSVEALNELAAQGKILFNDKARLNKVEELRKKGLYTSDDVEQEQIKTTGFKENVDENKKIEEHFKSKPIVSGAGVSFDIDVKTPKELHQKYLKKEGLMPKSVFDSWSRSQRKAQRQIEQSNFLAKDLKKALKSTYGKTKTGTPKVSTNQLEQINDILGRLGSDRLNRNEILKELPEQLREPISRMRDHIDAMSTALARSGMVEGDLVGKIQDNLGFYLTRTYRTHSDKKWNWKNIPDEVKIKAARVIKGDNPDMTIDEIEGYMRELVDNKDVNWGLSGGKTIGSKDLGILKKRKDIPIEIRELLGEYKDPTLNYMTSIAKLSYLVENNKFLEDIKESGLGIWLHSKPKGDFNIKIAADQSPTLAPLNGLYTTREIYDEFKKMKASQIPDWLRYWMTANSWTKYGKTILSPKTHVRNFTSNFMFQIANGRVDPSVGIKPFKVFVDYIRNKNNKEFREYYLNLVELGVVGESVRANEMKKNLNESWMYQQDFEKHGDNIFSKHKLSKPLRWTERAYQVEDDIHKVYAFEIEKKRYKNVFEKKYPDKPKEEINVMSDERAAEIVRSTMPTYSELPRLIEQLRRFPITGSFVSFPAEVLRTSYNTIDLATKEIINPETRNIGINRLIGLSSAVVLTGMLSLMSRIMIGMDADDEEEFKRFLPPWSRNSDILFIENKGDGLYTYVDLGFSDPHNYIKKPANAIQSISRGKNINEALLESAKELLDPFFGEEILLGRIQDIRSNKEKSSGRPVYNPVDSPGDRFLSMLEYLAKGVEPGGVSDAKRIAKAYRKKISDFGGTASPTDEILGVITGQKIQKLDIGSAYYWRSKESGEDISEAINMYRSAKNKADRGYRVDLDAEYKKANKSLTKAFDEARQDYLSALNLGVPSKDLYKTINNLRFGNYPNKKLSKAIVFGIYPTINRHTGNIEFKKQ